MKPRTASKTVFDSLQGYWKLGRIVRIDIWARLVFRIIVDGTASPIKAVISGASCSTNTYLLRILIHNQDPCQRCEQRTDPIGCTLGNPEYWQALEFCFDPDFQGRETP